MHCHNPPHPEGEAFHAHLHPVHVLKKCRILPGYHGLLSGERHRFKPAGQGRPDTMQRLCVQDHGLACAKPSAVCTPQFKRIRLLVCLAYCCLCGEKGLAMDALDGKTPAASARAAHPMTVSHARHLRFYVYWFRSAPLSPAYYAASERIVSKTPSITAQQLVRCNAITTQKAVLCI